MVVVGRPAAGRPRRLASVEWLAISVDRRLAERAIAGDQVPYR
jgi:hypothetical protein